MDEASLPDSVVPLRPSKSPTAWRYRQMAAHALKLRRTEKHWSFHTLAHHTGLLANHLRRVEAMAHSVSLEDACLIADALGVSLDALTGRHEASQAILGETIQRNSVHDWILLGMLLDEHQRAAVLNWYKAQLRRPLLESLPFQPPARGDTAYA